MVELEGFESSFTVTKTENGRTYELIGFDCKGCKEKGKKTYIPYNRSGNHKEKLKRHLIDEHGVILMVDVYNSYDKVWGEPVSDELARELFDFG